MSRYFEGEHHRQATLLSEQLDDYIKEDNPVRVMEALEEELDLLALGFEEAQPKETGRPS